MITIESLDDSRVKIFSQLKDRLFENENLILAESEKVLIKLLNSKNEIHSIFSHIEIIEKYKDRLSSDTDIFVASKDLLKKIVGENKHHGVFALAKRPDFTELDSLSNKILILNGLTSPENVGSIIRSAAAFKINSLIYDNKTVSPFSRRCIRVSMGNIFSMNIHKSDNLVATLEILKNRDFHVYATANMEQSVNVRNLQFEHKSALIIGSEGHGIEQEVLRSATSTIKIPIEQEVAHLNAGHASAIFLYLMGE